MWCMLFDRSLSTLLLWNFLEHQYFVYFSIWVLVRATMIPLRGPICVFYLSMGLRFIPCSFFVEWSKNIKMYFVRFTLKSGLGIYYDSTRYVLLSNACFLSNSPSWASRWLAGDVTRSPDSGARRAGSLILKRNANMQFFFFDYNSILQSQRPGW